MSSSESFQTETDLTTNWAMTSAMMTKCSNLAIRPKSDSEKLKEIQETQESQYTELKELISGLQRTISQGLPVKDSPIPGITLTPASPGTDQNSLYPPLRSELPNSRGQSPSRIDPNDKFTMSQWSEIVKKHRGRARSRSRNRQPQLINQRTKQEQIKITQNSYGPERAIAAVLHVKKGTPQSEIRNWFQIDAQWFRDENLELEKFPSLYDKRSEKYKVTITDVPRAIDPALIWNEMCHVPFGCDLERWKNKPTMKLSELPIRKSFFLGRLAAGEDSSERIKQAVEKIYLESDTVEVQKVPSPLIPEHQRKTASYCITISRKDYLVPINNSIIEEFNRRFAGLIIREWNGPPLRRQRPDLPAPRSFEELFDEDAERDY